MQRHGRARVNSSHPEAFALCDRCGSQYNLPALTYQYEWRGPQLASTGYKVCGRCLDKPFIFNKPILLGPDPVPVKDPRPPYWWAAAMANANLVFDDESNWVTEDGDQLTYENNTSTD